MHKPIRTKHWTWDDYVELPEDGSRYEVLDGELVVMAAPTMEHQYALMRVIKLLERWVDAGAGGLVVCAPVDVRLAYDIVVQPDVVWIPAHRDAAIVKKQIVGIPDLVVEILSPATARRDVTRKAEIYARYRAYEYWIVDPIAQTVEMLEVRQRTFVRHAFGSGDVRLLSKLEPELEVVPGTLFRTFPDEAPTPNDDAGGVRDPVPPSRPPRARRPRRVR